VAVIAAFIPLYWLPITGEIAKVAPAPAWREGVTSTR
jgi:hypothetical protein